MRVEHMLAAVAEITGTELSPQAIAMMAGDLAEYPAADVAAALTRCRRELKGRLTLADVLERLPAAARDPHATVGLDDYGRGYRDALFGKGRRAGESADWAAGYEAGVAERQTRRAQLVEALSAPRHSKLAASPATARMPASQADAGVSSRPLPGNFKRITIPSEVLEKLPQPPAPGSSPE